MRPWPDLIDVWYDSGAMGVAQWGFRSRIREMFEQSSPRLHLRFGGQTRGGFFSQLPRVDAVTKRQLQELHQPGAHLTDKCRKMSKSRATRRALERGRTLRRGRVRAVHVNAPGPPASRALSSSGGRGRPQLLPDAEDVYASS